MQQPVYDSTTGPPVSSAPDVPSHATGDYRDEVDDVNRSYQDLQDSLTGDQQAVVGKVKDSLAAPTEVAPGGGLSCGPNSGPMCHAGNFVGRHTEGFARGAGAAAGESLAGFLEVFRALGACLDGRPECDAFVDGFVDALHTLVTDPGRYFNDLWHGYWDPIQDAIDRGEYGEAAGRAAVGIIASLSGPKTPGRGPPGTGPGHGGRDPKALPPGTHGSVTRNFLEDSEPAQAADVVNYRGGHFEGQTVPRMEGIDGWREGVPASLKGYSGTNYSGLAKTASKAEQQAHDAGYRGVELYLFTPNMPAAEIAQSAVLAQITRQGTIGVIYVHAADGWVVFPGG